MKFSAAAQGLSMQVGRPDDRKRIEWSGEGGSRIRWGRVWQIGSGRGRNQMHLTVGIGPMVV